MNKKIVWINVTKECNVDCPRCYLTEESRKQKDQISNETLMKILKDEYMVNYQNNIDVIYEGGEVSLLGEKRFEQILRLTREILPNANIGMVTNCYAMPRWLIRLCKEYMNGVIETTYALGNKLSLSGNSDTYQRKFIDNIKKCLKENLTVNINLEVNAETVRLGPKALIDVMKQTGAKNWFMDQSVAFNDALKKKKYNFYGAPILETTVSYNDLSEYLISLYDNYSEFFNENNIVCSPINHNGAFFNELGSNLMLSFNPDGNCTTNVMYSDFEGTFIGNIKRSTIAEMISSKTRKNLLRWERNIRIKDCLTCDFYSDCKGGSSFLPLYDESGDCAGLIKFRNHTKKEG